MSRAAKIIRAVMVSMMVGTVVGLLLASHWGIVWMAMHLVILPPLMLGTDTRWGVTILSWIIPNTQLVRTMDYAGDIQYVLAYGEAGQVLHGHLYWFTEVGELQLHPNGYVWPDIGYVYFWEPTNTDQRACMHLTYDCVQWDKLDKMPWTHREDYRQQLKSQTKLNHESHI
jgi:hypothetical protein